MSDIPPKQPINGTASARVASAYGLPPLPQADLSPDIDETGALVAIHNAATQSGPDSFPVLKAFQDYLESERRRARRRVALVSSLFAGILIFVIAVFLLAGLLLFRYMKENQDNLWRKLEAQVLPPPVVVASAPAATTATPEAEALSGEFKRLDAALADLKSDNEKLREQLAAPPLAPVAPVAAPVPIRAPAPAVSPSPPAVLPSPPLSVTAVPVLKPSTLTTAPGVVQPLPPEGYIESCVYLQPAGKGTPVPWHVFVPTR